MYVNKNKLIITIICLASIVNANCCFATNTANIKIVGLFKNRAIVLDAEDNRKVLGVGDSASGFKLVSANSSKAIFQDNQGSTVTIGINNDISVSYSDPNASQPDASSPTQGSASNDKSANKSTPNVNEQPSHTETIKLNAQNQYIATVSINGNDVVGIIDTGASFVTLNSHVADQLGLDYKNNALKINVATDSDKTDGYKFVLKSLGLGSIRLPNVDAVIIEGTNPEYTLIGMSFLKHLDLQYLGDHLEIKKHVDTANTTPATTPTTSNNTLNNNTPTTATTPPAKSANIPESANVPNAAPANTPNTAPSNAPINPTTSPSSLAPTAPITQPTIPTSSSNSTSGKNTTTSNSSIIKNQ